MINNIKKAVSAILFHAAALAMPAAVLAQGDPEDPADIVPGGPSGIKDINNIIAIVQTAIKFILILAFVLAFVFLIIGGIRWIIAGGDEKGVAAARGMITAALIGLVIVLVSFALIRLVEVFFGVTILSEDIGIPKITDFEGTTTTTTP